MRAPEKTFVRARQLRRDLSLPEALLWDCLRAGRLEGLRFRRQHPVGRYVVDFYCPVARLAVEVDGAHHDHPAQIHHDRQRDGWLAEHGIRVMRLAAGDVLDDRTLEGVLKMIVHVASGADMPEVYSSPFATTMPPPPPSAVPLPRFAGEEPTAPPALPGSSPVYGGGGPPKAVEGAHAEPAGEVGAVGIAAIDTPGDHP